MQHDAPAGPAPAGNSHRPAGAARPMGQVGIAGLGRMGQAFARNLLADGYRVTVFDRDAARGALLAAGGAEVARAVAGLAACRVVLTSLPDDQALADVALGAGGLVETLPRGAIHVSMSTVSPGLSRQLAERHQRAGQLYVAAPVLGNPDAAQARTLFVLVGVPPTPLRRCRRCWSGWGSGFSCWGRTRGRPI